MKCENHRLPLQDLVRETDRRAPRCKRDATHEVTPFDRFETDVRVLCPGHARGCVKLGFIARRIGGKP